MTGGEILGYFKKGRVWGAEPSTAGGSAGLFRSKTGQSSTTYVRGYVKQEISRVRNFCNFPQRVFSGVRNHKLQDFRKRSWTVGYI